jgi:hypothetical protein
MPVVLFVIHVSYGIKPYSLGNWDNSPLTEFHCIFPDRIRDIIPRTPFSKLFMIRRGDDDVEGYPN